MKTLEQLAAEQNAERAKLERQHEISAMMPECPDTVQLNGKRAPWIIYRKRNIAEAISLFTRFDIIPMVHARGTFGHVCPRDMIDERGPVEEKAGPFAAKLIVHSGGQFGASANLDFYARIGGFDFMVHVDLEGPGYIGTFPQFAAHVSEGRDGRRRLISRSFGANQFLAATADHIVTFAGGESGPIKTYGDHTYLFQADADAIAPGGENRHAVDQLGILADHLTPRLIESGRNADYYSVGAEDGTRVYQAAKRDEAPTNVGSGYRDLDALKRLKGDL